jgi:hypothetical protein
VCCRFNFRITATFLGKPPVVVRQSTYDDLDAAEVISLNLTEYESSAETFATQVGVLPNSAATDSVSREQYGRGWGVCKT